MTILYLMAADAEYGPHLRSRISPEIIGVGPVEAAIATTRLLEARREALPRLVVSLGSAGSRRLAQCEVYQATSVSYRDMDASAFGFVKGETPFLNLPAKLPLAPLVPGLKPASLSTGANVVSGQAYDALAEDMVDMETYAVLRASMGFGVPVLALRGISDGKEDATQLADWTQYLHIVDEKLAQAIDLVQLHWR
ncbi:MAG: 5'-methylthioadenosine/S-adenosylhomocysteine nucleosidase [Devosia sp.]|uniref:5'-methylthioadenosine/S-adenosylhomocysteine nucleosidase n=1 Tax=Devosia sp. TaxID=1871048 RepID=UPI0024C700F7|nr:5'-methylthioadenosine/S-adenosylhomocysteine nucleosidase [Devosia sp.]UYO00454.1 MAG: 5'-methylthioadenosine/S-adenosylhomocysteine nucleosidase [Devosia sp.]